MEWDDDCGLSFAQDSLASYGLPQDTPLKLISLSENATYLVGDETIHGVLRVYRANYQTEAAKHSELAWISDLRATNTVATPAVIPNRVGEELTRVQRGDKVHDIVMFDFVAGKELAPTGVAGEHAEMYAQIGGIVASLHHHVLTWDKPDWFERMHWNVETVLGSQAPWGNWRGAPGVTDKVHHVIEQAEKRLCDRLAHYPQHANNSGLVHGDLRTTNILESDDGKLWVIDFDDAGNSWLLWDLCTATSFIEHTPELDGIVNAWLTGYMKERELTVEDLSVVPDLIFLRRLHLLAWIGTHAGADAVKELEDSFAEETALIAERYLNGKYLDNLEVVHQATQRMGSNA